MWHSDSARCKELITSRHAIPRVKSSRKEIVKLHDCYGKHFRLCLKIYCEQSLIFLLNHSSSKVCMRGERRSREKRVRNAERRKVLHGRLLIARCTFVYCRIRTWPIELSCDPVTNLVKIILCAVGTKGDTFGKRSFPNEARGAESCTVIQSWRLQHFRSAV